jgi:hypothetical protein
VQGAQVQGAQVQAEQPQVVGVSRFCLFVMWASLAPGC